MSKRRKPPANPREPGTRKRGGPAGGRRVTLKDVAASLDLSPATVSLVLNRSPVADSIPSETQERVLAAARALGYRPDMVARSLRSRRSYSVGIVVPEVSDGYAARVLSGVEDPLMEDGYFFLVASHRSDGELLTRYLQLLSDRLVEGFILVNTPLTESPELPSVAIAGHHPLDRVTNVVIDHQLAAELALSHLAELGHERIAFFKGHSGSADTEVRWRAITAAARSHGISLRRELTLQLGGDAVSQRFTPEEAYQEGYAYGRRLLALGQPFTALFAFNDVSAIGAMRAFLDAGLSVPEDVSVVGFDDIQSAAFQNPSLTTVRQPLHEMGTTAGRILLDQLAGRDPADRVVTVVPELVTRASTGPAPAGARRRPRRRASARG